MQLASWRSTPGFGGWGRSQLTVVACLTSRVFFIQLLISVATTLFPRRHFKWFSQSEPFSDCVATAAAKIISGFMDVGYEVAPIRCSCPVVSNKRPKNKLFVGDFVATIYFSTRGAFADRKLILLLFPVN